MIIAGIISGATITTVFFLWWFSLGGPVRIGALSGDLHHLPLFVAIENGYFTDEGLEIDGCGNIIIKTPIENIVDSDLFIYQDCFGIRHQIEGKFVIKNNQEYGFQILGDYCRQEILVIDPKITLKYSSFIGWGHSRG